MPSFKPAYLIHGDDHGRIAERRSRLKALAEAEGGVQSFEVLEGESSTPETVAVALSSLTFAIGRRFIVVEGVERWKERDLPPLLAALASPPPETTVVFFAREEGRAKAPAPLVKAVEQAGGDVATEMALKPWELPKWVAGQARGLGIELDGAAAAVLVRHVGERQQRLLRELEKLALTLGRGATVSAETVEELTARSSERRAWTLADALLGAEAAGAVREYLRLRVQGERVPSLMYWMTSRMREALRIADSLDAGASPADVRRGMRMPSKAADALIAAARQAGPARLRAGMAELADLELASRGGGPRAAEDTAAIRAIARIAPPAASA